MSYASVVMTADRSERAAKLHVCPVWIGYLLASPLRRLVESPHKMLGPHVQAGDTVLEVGCAMGFFSLPLARMVGSEGRLLCVDIQEPMIERLRRRARRAGLLDRIETSVCTPSSLGLDSHRGVVDFAAALHVLHEVPDQAPLFAQIHELLKPGSRLLIVEPKGHVTAEAFARSLAYAKQVGLGEITGPDARLRRPLSALLEKPASAD